MTFYLKEEFLSFDHFDIWDEQDQLVYSADREFFTFGKKLNVEDASRRQIAAIQHVPFSIPCTYVLTIEGQDYDLTRNFAFFSRSYSLDALGWEIEGDFMSLEYAITKNDATVASIQREFLTLGSRYALEVADPQDALLALCVVLAIDCCDEERNQTDEIPPARQDLAGGVFYGRSGRDPDRCCWFMPASICGSGGLFCGA